MPRHIHAAAAYHEAEERIVSASERLDLQIPELEEIPPLHELNLVEQIDLKGTRVSDLSPLKHLLTLTRLNLEGTLVSDLRPLANLKSLRFLNLRGTPVADISPISGLHELRSLNLWSTKISDLSFLSRLKSLERLDFDDTRVSDISPLSGLSKITALYFTNTSVSDLEPLRRLGALRYLDLDSTLVSDISPLAYLTRLRGLSMKHMPHLDDLSPISRLSQLSEIDLESTPISDIAPLSKLTALESINLSETKVSDLSPLAGLTRLVDSALRDKQKGLLFSGCDLAETALMNFAELNNPERTIGAINYLREQQNLRPYNSISDDGASSIDEDVSANRPPQLPAQTPGPNFAIGADGVIGFAPPGEIDRDGNDIERLSSLHNSLKEVSRALTEGLTSRDNYYPKLASAARKYFQQVNQDIDKIDFAILYGTFLMLEVAEQTTHRDIENKICPPLDEGEVAALRSLKWLHGPFILSTKIGKDLLEAAEYYLRNAAEQSALREAAVALSAELKHHPEIIRAAVAEFIDTSANVIGQGPNVARNAAFGDTAVKNVSIVVIAGAVIATLPLAGGLLGDWLATIPLGVLSFIGYEALKRTKAHDHVAGNLAGAVDNYGSRAVEWAQRLPRQTLDSYVAFVLRMESTIRALAGKNSEGPLLNALLDWLKTHANRNSP